MDKLKVGIIGTSLAFSPLHFPAYQGLSTTMALKLLNL